MAKIEKDITIKNEHGLHIRVASEFVKIASQYHSEVTILKDDKTINGKSIMSVLTLEASFNTQIKLIIEGDDAEQALEKLEEILVANKEL